MCCGFVSDKLGKLSASQVTKCEKGGVNMGKREPNTDIRCRVASCSYHCGDCDYCSLNSIQIEPCQNCGSGKVDDESMCASYRGK